MIRGTISTKAGQYTIPEGYHDGSGKVGSAQLKRIKSLPAILRAEL